MAQTSSQWRNLVSLIQSLPIASQFSKELTNASFDMRQLPWRRWSTSGGWLLVTGGTIGLLFWNGRLVVATGAGVAVMLLVYLLQDGKWRPFSNLQESWKGWNQSFILAAASGSAATFGTYLAASMWAEVGSPWIATGMLLQQAATLGTLGLLIWQRVNRQEDLSSHPTLRLSQVLDDLTHTHPLKRLIAVRQISELIEQQTVSGASLKEIRTKQRQLADYLRVMLSREDDPIVRDAALEGLQVLETTRSLAPSKTQPITMTRSTSKVRQRMPMQ